MHTILPPLAPHPLRERLRLRLTGWAWRLLARLPPRLGHALLRRQQAGFRPQSGLGPGQVLEQQLHGGVPVVWVDRRLAASRGTLVYLHGGAYVAGIDQVQWQWLLAMGRRCGLAVAAVRYRQPPDHPFPAALEDATEALGELLRSDVLPPGRWLLAGDGAGGGLALAVQRYLLDGGLPPAAGLLLLAPWADLALASPELDAAQRSDPLLRRGWLGWAARLYAGSLPLAYARLSPLNECLAGLPPVHLAVGTRELLRPDVQRLYRRLQAADVEATLVEQDGGCHGFGLRLQRAEAQRLAALHAAWIERRLEEKEVRRAAAMAQDQAAWLAPALREAQAWMPKTMHHPLLGDYRLRPDGSWFADAPDFDARHPQLRLYGGSGGPDAAQLARFRAVLARLPEYVASCGLGDRPEYAAADPAWRDYRLAEAGGSSLGLHEDGRAWLTLEGVTGQDGYEVLPAFEISAELRLHSAEWST